MKIFTYLVLLLMPISLLGQQIDYQVRVSEVFSAADDSDGSGNEDPVWKIYLTDNDGGPQQYSGCINNTQPYNSWWTGAGMPFTTWFTRSNTVATMFTTQMEAWEDDGCSSTCNYNTSCLFNDDDAHAPVGTSDGTTAATQDIDFTLDEPCTWNQYSISIVGDNNNGSPSQYAARILVYWTPSTIDPGVIAGDQTLCSGGDPSILGSTSDGTPADFPSFFTYQWQEDVGCSGTWIDVPGATSSTYDPPIGISQTTCFRRLVKSTNCSDAISNTITVTVDAASTDPTSINATSTSFCAGGNTDLTVSGGSLGVGASWVWYENGCGAGTSIGTGATINVTPTATTSYYVRAEGTCNTTICANITVTVEQASTDPTGIAASTSNVCPGQSATLSVSGGTLGDGATWEWYEGSCGGVSVGSGNAISVSPSSSTTYYVRAEGNCGNTNCVSTTITVGAGSSAPTSADVTVDNICPGVSTQVYVTGAALPSGYTWVWYTGACGAVPVGVGDTLDVSPTSTTTYYVRSVGTCGESSCESVTVNVLPGSVAADGIDFTNNNFCPGDSTVLSVVGGALDGSSNWVWYENGCGSGTSIGTGSSITLSPQTSTAYYVRAEGGTCGNTTCQSVLINVQEANAYMLPFDTICGMSTPFDMLNGIPEGGTYSGVGVVNNTFDPQSAGDGTHTITYSYTTTSGCIATAQSTITILPSDLAVTAVMELETCNEGGVTLVASANGGDGFYSFLWSNGSGGNPLTYVEPGDYTVYVKDGNDCWATSEVVNVNSEVECIDMPNSFTPNGDGMNDTWNLDFSSYNSVSIEVYSKWGKIVWSSDAKTIAWDGIVNGNPLPSGTYYYLLDLNNGEVSQNGTVTIVR